VLTGNNEEAMNLTIASEKAKDPREVEHILQTALSIARQAARNENNPDIDSDITVKMIKTRLIALKGGQNDGI
jgi:hypothetical protein